MTCTADIRIELCKMYHLLTITHGMQHESLYTSWLYWLSCDKLPKQTKSDVVLKIVHRLDYEYSEWLASCVFRLSRRILIAFWLAHRWNDLDCARWGIKLQLQNLLTGHNMLNHRLTLPVLTWTPGPSFPPCPSPFPSPPPLSTVVHW